MRKEEKSQINNIKHLSEEFRRAKIYPKANRTEIIRAKKSMKLTTEKQ